MSSLAVVRVEDAVDVLDVDSEVVVDLLGHGLPDDLGDALGVASRTSSPRSTSSTATGPTVAIPPRHPQARAACHRSFPASLRRSRICSLLASSGAKSSSGGRSFTLLRPKRSRKVQRRAIEDGAAWLVAPHLAYEPLLDERGDDALRIHATYGIDHRARHGLVIRDDGKGLESGPAICDACPMR